MCRLFRLHRCADPFLRIAAWYRRALSHTFDAGTYANGSGRSMELPRYFPRAHPNVSATEYWAHPSDWPGVFWHNDTAQPGGIHPTAACR